MAERFPHADCVGIGELRDDGANSRHRRITA
jgi:hypothetical protein